MIHALVTKIALQKIFVRETVLVETGGWLSIFWKCVGGVGLVLAVPAGMQMYAFKQTSKPAVGNPSDFRKDKAAGKSHRGILVACLGDSLTHGVCNPDWVDALRNEMVATHSFINAGVNGDTSWNVDQRLRDDVLPHAVPDAVVLLVGSNDCMGTYNDDDGKLYMRDKGLPEALCLEVYQKNMRSILNQLRAAGVIKRAVMTLPPLGEKQDSAANKLVAAFNEHIEAIAKETDTTLLPLNAKLWQALEGRHPTANAVYDSDGKLMRALPMLKALRSHYVWGRSWDQCADEQDMFVLCDRIHLSDRGGAIVKDLVQAWLTS